MKQRIKEWLSENNLAKARGKTRQEIFLIFGSKLEPIAYIKPKYMKRLDKNLTDNKVYSGKGYFIDHAINHHPELPISEYYKIQDILDDPDRIKLDEKEKIVCRWWTVTPPSGL
ncbi:MAG: hypothetical protein LBK68_02385 [Candidatus Margulisbacteria bacterium]|jgi:hypothetical protein|nr:hypothetical protein [Candidatus Margulisiibacteriota bacterium]